MVDIYERISTSIIAGDLDTIKALTQKALDEGVQSHEILKKGLLPGMEVVGQRFKACEIFIPEVLLSAKTMHTAMDLLRPFLSAADAAGAGTVVIGTVQGDLHDIGKNLVAMMLEGAGFRVVNAGVDVKPETLVEAVKTYQPNVLALSALLTTTMPKMTETIDAIKEAGLRDCTKILIGGAPVTQNFANKIGADAYGSNAGEAVEKAKMLSYK